MNYTEVLVALFAFLGGGGLYRIITMRSQRRKMANQVSREEYSSVEEIVTRFQNTLADMADRQSKLTERNSELEQKIAQLEREKRGNTT
jgi:phage shock protein A